MCVFFRGFLNEKRMEICDEEAKQLTNDEQWANTSNSLGCASVWGELRKL